VKVDGNFMRQRRGARKNRKNYPVAPKCSACIGGVPERGQKESQEARMIPQKNGMLEETKRRDLVMEVRLTACVRLRWGLGQSRLPQAQGRGGEITRITLGEIGESGAIKKEDLVNEG